MIYNVDDSNVLDSSSSSKGNQDKWHIDNKWIKQDDLGYEALAEVLSSIVLSRIDSCSFVRYDFCDIRRREVVYSNCCVSDDCTGGDTLVTLQRLFEELDFPVSNLDNLGVAEAITLVSNLIFENYNLDIRDYLGRIIYFDSIVLNEDRHLHNIHLLNCGNKLTTAPLFDNGASLLSDLADYPLITSNLINIRRVKSKPFTSSFNKQVSGVKKLGIAPLKIDIDNLLKDIEEFSTDRYSIDIQNRCKEVLRYRLRELEGKAWLRI